MGTVARLAQSVEHETLNLRVVGSSTTLGDLQHGRINVSVQIFIVDTGKLLLSIWKKFQVIIETNF